MQLADGLRAEAGDPEQLDEARRDLGATSSLILSLIAPPTPATFGGLPERYAATRSIALRPIVSAARW